MTPDTLAITFPVVMLASAMVPEDVMVPPVMPLFVAILVTVPDGEAGKVHWGMPETIVNV